MPLSDGNIAEAYWTSSANSGATTNIYFRTISSTAGNALTAAAQVNAAPLKATAVNVNAVELANGGIAFNWEQADGVSHATRVFSSSGAAAGAATVYDAQGTNGDGNNPGTETTTSIAAGKDGSYIVEYPVYYGDATTGTTELRYSIFNSDGSVRFDNKVALSTPDNVAGKVIALDNGTYAYLYQDTTNSPKTQSVLFINPTTGNVTGAPVSTAVSIASGGDTKASYGTAFHSSNGAGFVIASTDANYNVYLNYYNTSGVLQSTTTADGTGTPTTGGYSNVALTSGYSRGVIDEELHFGSGTTTNRTIQTFDIPQPPTVTPANIHVSGATGNGGVYKIGDTVTATWNNTAAGDNNAASSITVSAVAATPGPRPTR